uniref:RelA/SpoT domain-containing protein n=1 Tax=Rhodosorus marinus TaxID=101924 RepID=A0A7S2ZFQ1_9RHOD|mmetsp:Transcript_16547/g.67941  ORF Transcript_16547/g.67941 Transcript_16547/m.67941 type:complete len:442 (+) Transcript_16547:51-1376(+)
MRLNTPIVLSMQEDDEVMRSTISKYVFSPVSNLASLTPGKPLPSGNSARVGSGAAVALPRFESAFGELDEKLAYLNKTAKYKARKTLTLAIESCTSKDELVRCKGVFSLLADLELDHKTLLAGVVSTLRKPSSQLTSLLDPEVTRLVESRKVLHERLMRSTSSEKLSETQLSEVLENLCDFRIVAIELVNALMHLRWSISSLDESSRVRLKSFADLTLSFYAPLAHTCGFAVLQRELEERAFEVSHPEEYERLKEAVKEKTSLFAEVLDESRRKVESLLWDDPQLRTYVSCVKVSGRQKSLYSIHKKMEKKGLSLDEVLDVLALRVIVTPRWGGRVSDSDGEISCYRAMALVQDKWDEYKDMKVKDYIKHPKENGYQSLHTTVAIQTDVGEFPLEIQIRSEEMHRVAELGTAAHVQYKGQGVIQSHPHIGNMRHCIGKSLP